MEENIKVTLALEIIGLIHHKLLLVYLLIAINQHLIGLLANNGGI